MPVCVQQKRRLRLLYVIVGMLPDMNECKCTLTVKFFLYFKDSRRSNIIDSLIL